METDDLTPCVYCGLPATGRDHVPPISVYTRLLDLGVLQPGSQVTVPACHQCNSWLGARPPWTVGARRQLIKSKLRKKFHRLLATPDWTPEELDQLGPRLRQAVIGALQKRDLIRARIDW